MSISTNTLEDSSLPCDVHALRHSWAALTDLASTDGTPTHFDAVCFVSRTTVPAKLHAHFEAARLCDAAFESELSCFAAPSGAAAASQPALRIVYAPIGELDDYDDVRVYERAAARAIARALKAGARRPLIVLPGAGEAPERIGAAHAARATLLGALAELYVPIQLREASTADEKTAGHRRADALFVWSAGDEGRSAAGTLAAVLAVERARLVARDIGGGDPERMTPQRVREYVERQLAGRPNVSVRVVEGRQALEAGYPLFAAVDRAAAAVPRHRGCIVFVEYKPRDAVRKSLLLVGKGVTYDTGGADIKAGGVMAGMSRDKCGAAAVAGFMRLVAERQPAGVAVVGVLCMVRNSVGEECYVSDEVMAARSGKRVRVGNTDAEGRMAMADALCEMKERALSLPDPHLFTVATLTGHAWLAHGVGYSIAIDNGPARAAGHAERLKRAGDACGEPFEVSTLQREDFAAHAGQALGEDLLQACNQPSSRVPRGHQTPAAFLVQAAGLAEHGLNGPRPLKYTHLDIAGSAGDVPHQPTGAPILALAEVHLSVDC